MSKKRSFFERLTGSIKADEEMDEEVHRISVKGDKKENNKVGIIVYVNKIYVYK